MAFRRRRSVHERRIRRRNDLPQPRLRDVANTLGLIRNAGIEPTVIEYLKTPPSRALLKDLLDRMGMLRANF